MSEVDSRHVKHGVWVNLDKGPVMGRTITTDIRTGTLLVALLAVLASLAVTNLWHIVAFTYHQTRSDGRPADGLFRQQQVLLRTLPPPGSLFADSLKLWQLWRKRTQRALLRVSFPLVLSLVFMAATLIVGIFSSYVVDSTNLQILVDSGKCAPLDMLADPKALVQNILALKGYKTSVTSRSVPYAQECYGNSNGTALPTRCKAFVRASVPLPSEKVDCPFDSKICAIEANGGISVDSGLLDTNDVFGWNLRGGDKIRFRRKATCAVLKTEGHSWIMNATDYPYNTRPVLPGEELVAANYGKQRRGGDLTNVTLTASLTMANITYDYLPGAANSMLSLDYDAVSSIYPLPELASDDADLTLLMIVMNAVKYGKPVNDPLFRAHKPFLYQNAMLGNMTQYYADWPIGVLGCRQQYQYCFAQAGGKSDVCTPLSGLPGRVTPEQYPAANPIQLAALQVLTTTNILFDIGDAADKALSVRNMGRGDFGGLIPSLPDDQWIREVIGFEKLVWASYQTIVSDYAVGYGVQDPSAQKLVRNETTQAERSVCQAQRMMKSGGFVNINVFGLAFIVTFSVLVTAIDTLLLKFVIYVSRFRKALAPRIDRWVQDGVFQLQRHAFEGHRAGTWQMLEKEIPVTIKDEVLEELPVEASQRRDCEHLCKTCAGNQRVGTFQSSNSSNSKSTMVEDVYEEGALKA